MASLNEVLKNSHRMIYNLNGNQLKPGLNKKFALKADGSIDYLRGNYSLLSYERAKQTLKINAPKKTYVNRGRRVKRKGSISVWSLVTLYEDIICF